MKTKLETVIEAINKANSEAFELVGSSQKFHDSEEYMRKFVDSIEDGGYESLSKALNNIGVNNTFYSLLAIFDVKEERSSHDICSIAILLSLAKLIDEQDKTIESLMEALNKEFSSDTYRDFVDEKIDLSQKAPRNRGKAEDGKLTNEDGKCVLGLFFERPRGI